MSCIFVKPGAIKKYFKEKGMRSKKGFVEIFDRSITQYLDKAIMKAKEDRRKTIEGKDVL